MLGHRLRARRLGSSAGRFIRGPTPGAGSRKALTKRRHKSWQGFIYERDEKAIATFISCEPEAGAAPLCTGDAEGQSFWEITPLDGAGRRGEERREEGDRKG